MTLTMPIEMIVMMVESKILVEVIDMRRIQKDLHLLLSAAREIDKGEAGEQR